MKIWNVKVNLLGFFSLVLIIHSAYSTKIKRNDSNIELFNPYHVLYPNSTMGNINEYGYSQGNCQYNFNCFLPYGICVNATTCLCMPDYAHVNIEGISISELCCSYRRKKVVVAALLELFLPMGLGHLYVGHYFLGMMKFCYMFFLYIFCCVLYYKGTNNEMFSNMMFLCVILSCLIPLWNIFDLFMFFLNKYTDGSGVPLA